MNRFGEVAEVAELVFVARLAALHLSTASVFDLSGAEQRNRATLTMKLMTDADRAAAGLSAKKFSSREIVDACWPASPRPDGKLHAFNRGLCQGGQGAGRCCRHHAARLPARPLHGLPIVYKDLCDIAGRVGTGGSEDVEKRVAAET